MLPVSDVIPSRTTPWVTLAIITANVSIFLYERLLSAPELTEFLRHASFIPGSVSLAGATASIVAHENALHVVLNGLALWIFGDNVEDQLGHLRFLASYFVAGAAAAFAVGWAAPASFVPMLAASGAVAGVIGAYFVLFPRSRVLVLVPSRSLVDAVELPALVVAALWFVSHVAGGLGRLAAPWGDGGAAMLWLILGGLSTGMLVARVAQRPERRRVDWWGA